METKICTRPNCHAKSNPQPITEFYRRGKRGVQTWCKPCQMESARDWQKKNPIRFRQSQLDWRGKNESKMIGYNVRKFGLAPEEYQRLLAKQDGKCAICENPPSTMRLAVDHDHTTGRVRQLLCGPCNRGLGMFNHDGGLLLKALTYLTLHELR